MVWQHAGGQQTWRNTRKLSRKSKPNFNILKCTTFKMSWGSAIQQKSDTTLSSFLGLLVPLAGFFMAVSVPSIEIVVKTTVLSIVVKITVVVSWDLEKLRSHTLFWVKGTETSLKQLMQFQHSQNVMLVVYGSTSSKLNQVILLVISLWDLARQQGSTMENSRGWQWPRTCGNCSFT